MRGKTAVVTGSTAGIGKETARGLARLGARVVLVGRDPERARRAAAELARDTGNEQVESVAADVTCLAGMRELAARVAERCDGVDVLINNVGVNGPVRQETADGVETMFAAHVLAPFALTRLLLPLLRAGAGGRVVNITGGIPGGPIELDNLQAERRFLGWTFTHYNHTKTILMAMSRRFARVLEGSGVTVNVAYPGHGDTPMNRSLPIRAFPYAYRPVVPVVKLVVPLLFGDLSKPSRSSVHLAGSAEVAGVSGAYFDQRCRRRPWPASVLDERTCDVVWELCERLGPAR
ncbi:SDR family NAD(P)-dependent oxidoreductase [Nonomuraea sp. SBT364]|uniref:SDR family NAD(P)-dependent oxidoreductase n=1 Tax=Nonomuraea sp. SBT364 TaxID=1580530 RepID=UPI00066E9691|nr:SDR family NAD(P)-dependent oxidoreductase [Nonomuraea sp. SBT364]